MKTIFFNHSFCDVVHLFLDLAENQHLLGETCRYAVFFLVAQVVLLVVSDAGIITLFGYLVEVADLGLEAIELWIVGTTHF